MSTERIGTLRISEIFGPTIQGEGVLIGEPTVFVRTGGCDYRCSWCDSLHAVDSQYRHTWQKMTPAEIWDEVQHLSGNRPLTVSLSGGNPAIQNLGPVISMGQAAGYRFACETQGSIPAPWFGMLDTLVLSPKPPSSGERVVWERFDDCVKAAGSHTQVVMKIVIFDEEDFAFARAAAASYPELPLYLQPGNPEVDPALPVDLDQAAKRLEWLVDLTIAAKWFRPRVLPQLHVMIWGNKRGV
ncbi:7-carboxy-7-deazaguanine synthase QueE (plasmid) [Thioclava sp. 'Guangxiensis']|uniref:7-carboxy-7-deazaguanine synthase QueE n=1 Tax=Thioclava sp. 'Guangxiensis' TaxID=3149044 RepID=UPI0032C47FDD